MVTDARPLAGEYTPGGERRPDRPDAGGRILLLASGDPEAALSLLRATVGAWDDGRLLGPVAGRREVICALGEIARAPEHFEEAASILLRLAATEGGSAPNGARGTFARLFANVPPSMASTRAGAGERTALLAELLDGGDGRMRLLALYACDTALKTANFMQVDCESGKPTMHLGWAIVGKEFDAYRKTLALLTERLGRMAPDEGREAARIILERAVDLSRHAEVSREAAAAVRMLHEGRLVDKGRLAQATEMIVGACACRAGERAAAAWASLLADMSGNAGRAAPGGGLGWWPAGRAPSVMAGSESGKAEGRNGRGAGRGRSR